MSVVLLTELLARRKKKAMRGCDVSVLKPSHGKFKGKNGK